MGLTGLSPLLHGWLLSSHELYIYKYWVIFYLLITVDPLQRYKFYILSMTKNSSQLIQFWFSTNLYWVLRKCCVIKCANFWFQSAIHAVASVVTLKIINCYVLFYLIAYSLLNVYHRFSFIEFNRFSEWQFIGSIKFAYRQRLAGGKILHQPAI